MHILFSGLEWFPDGRGGGLDRYFFEQLEAFAVAGHCGEAMVSSCQPVRMEKIAVHPMTEAGAGLWHRWKGARTIVGHALQEADLVNSHFALYAFPWLKGIPARVPLIVNFHGPWADEMCIQGPGLRRRIFAFFARQIERTVYQRADYLITLSEAFRDVLHRRYQVPLSRIRVIPGALHLDRYLAAPCRSEARRQMGWPLDRPILLSIRRLAKRMGLDQLVEAMQEIRCAIPNVLLLIGGRGPERETLQAQIDRLGLSGNVRLLGFVEENVLPLAYAAADFSVVPTAALEGFGLVTVESLASGTPVLATPVGANPEILQPLQPELIFDGTTPEAMARRIVSVLRGEMVLPAREVCRAHVQRYGWPQVLPKILAVYEEAIERKRGVPSSREA